MLAQCWRATGEGGEPHPQDTVFADRPISADSPAEQQIGAQFFRDKRKAANKMKGLVVGDPILVEAKGKDPVERENFTTWLILSNKSVSSATQSEGVPTFSGRGRRWERVHVHRRSRTRARCHGARSLQAARAFESR